MKAMLKFLLLVLLTTIVFSVVSALMPYSPSFKAAGQKADPSVILFVLITVAWICFTIIYIVQRARWPGKRLGIIVTLMLFLVLSFMTQIETMFFGDAFKILTTMDIVLIMMANGIIVITATPLAIKWFRNNSADMHSVGRDVSFQPADILRTPGLISRLALTGLAYVIIYFVFGYFVAWQEADLRVFYTGHNADNGFLDSLITNFRERPVIYPFQFIRGVLFGLFVLPLLQMFPDRPVTLLISLLLVFSSVAISLIIPNVLFPDSVRWAHFREMMSSMTVFAVLIWWIYTRDRVRMIQSVQS